MIKILQNMYPIFFLLLATLLEATGDALIRKAIFNYAGFLRIALMLFGALLLFGYGVALNLAPLEFGQVVGLYIATLFIVWQFINFFAFNALPSLAVITGGILIVAGGCIITFWKP